VASKSAAEMRAERAGSRAHPFLLESAFFLQPFEFDR
jgi:hypothetical protein